MNQTPVATSLIGFTRSNGTLSVVLWSDGAEAPWRLPFSSVPAEKSSINSLADSLKKTIGINVLRDAQYIEQLYTTESTDPTQYSVCIHYMGLFREINWRMGSKKTGLFPLNELPDSLTDGEKAMITYAQQRIQAKLLYSNLLAFLLPQHFTITEFQEAFDDILQIKSDRRNFRKKLLSLNIITPLSPKKPAKANTPTLHRFTSSKLTLIDKPFTIPRSTE